MARRDGLRAGKDLAALHVVSGAGDGDGVNCGGDAGLVGGLAARCGSLSLAGDLEAGGFNLPCGGGSAGGEGEAGGVGPAGVLGIYVTVRMWRDFNPRTLEKVMKSAWCPLGFMEMTIVEENFFLFRFDHKQDVSRILREGPWRFNDHPLGIAEARTGVRVTNELLTWVSYWIQIYNIPPMYHSQDTTERVASLIRKNYIAVDATVCRQPGVVASYVRVRVPINTAIRLPRGTSAWFGKDEVPLAFKFERLMKFCYICGLVDHEMVDCEGPYPENYDPADPPYGDWLRGIPPRVSSWQQQGASGGVGRGNSFMSAQVQPSRRSSLGPPPVVPCIASWSAPGRNTASPGFEIPQFNMGLTGNPPSKKPNRSFRPRTAEEQEHQEKKRSADGKGFNPFPPAT